MAIIALSSVSCDKDFEKVNTDPNSATAVPAHLLLGSIISSNQNIIYGMQQGGDMGMCWAQHASKVQYNDEERYTPRRGSIDGVWNSLYTNVLSDAQSMQTLAIAEGNTNIQGIGLFWCKVISRVQPMRLMRPPSERMDTTPIGMGVYCLAWKLA